MVEINENSLVRLAEGEMGEAVKDMVLAAAFVAAQPSELGDFLSSGAHVRAAVAQANLERARDLSRDLQGKTVIVNPETQSVED